MKLYENFHFKYQLNDDGIVTKETIQSFMDENIPEDAHELGHVLSEDCLADHGKFYFLFFLLIFSDFVKIFSLKVQNWTRINSIVKVTVIKILT